MTDIAEPPRMDTPSVSPQTSTRLVVASVGVLLLLASLDQTIVSTALPTIVADLGGLEHLSWVVTAYFLTSTVVAPLYGKLGDLYGRRNIVLVSVSIFLLGSALCGLAMSMPFLIAARALQGLGGGGLFVLALSIIGDVIPPSERGKVQGVFAGAFGISSVAGPLLGGWFVDVFSWHWIFYVNLPIGLAALAGFLFGFKANPERVKHKIDYAGAAALTVALSSMVLVSSLGGQQLAWTAPGTLALIAAGIASLIAFVMIERRAVEPILPMSLFSNSVFTVTSAISFLTGALMFGALTFIPVYLQIAKGATATGSGLQLLPMTAGILTASTISGRTMSRTGRYRTLPIIGMVIAFVGLAGLTQISPDYPAPALWASLAALGAGMGMIFPVITTAAQNAAPRAQLGSATAAGVMFRQVGGTIAVALFGALFTSRMAANIGEAAAGMGGNIGELGPQAIAHLDPALRTQIAEAVSSALSPIYAIAATLAVVGLLIALLLKDVPLAGRGPVPRSAGH